MARQTFVFYEGVLVPKQETRRIEGPYVVPDIPDYVSPMGSGLITSRSKRREDLKRHGCREVDPGEFKPEYNNERFAAKRGLPYTSKEEE